MKSRERSRKWIEAEAASLFCILLVIARHASRIVNSLLFCVAQGLVRLIYLGEHLWRVLRFVHIWMVLLCFQEERSLNFFVTGCGGDTKHVYRTAENTS